MLGIESTEDQSLSAKVKNGLLKHQLYLVLVHAVNLTSNILGNDFLSCKVRGKLLTLLGASLGRGTIVKGGGYIYGGKLVTGIECHINRNCYFDFTGSITFGDHVVVGHGVTLITAEHQIGSSEKRAGKVSGRSITVENGVWIGANSTILPGVVLGKGSIVAAGAVVTKSVAPNVIVAGVPAKEVKTLQE